MRTTLVLCLLWAALTALAVGLVQLPATRQEPAHDPGLTWAGEVARDTVSRVPLLRDLFR